MRDTGETEWEMMERRHLWAHRPTCRCEWCSAETTVPTADEPEFDPPRITCCETAIATGNAMHRPGCPNA